MHINKYTIEENLNHVAHKIIMQSVNTRTIKPVFIDATAGNGYDTVFLAKLVGENGIVMAFDIQKQALENTEFRLKKENLAQRVKFFHTGHENLKTIVMDEFSDSDKFGSERTTRCSVVMFNLGYLPGSTKKIITQPETTVRALESAIAVLAIDGIISIHCYAGHCGGFEETQAVDKWCEMLPASFDISMYGYQVSKENRCTEKLLCIRRS